MVSLKRFGPQNRWLKLEDLHDKPPLRQQIGLVKVEDGKFGERVVLVFEPSGQMLSLNATSVGNLLKDFGEDDTDWLGKTVEIHAGTVPTKSGDADALLVRGIIDVPADAAVAAKAKVSKAKVAKASDLDDEIAF